MIPEIPAVLKRQVIAMYASGVPQKEAAAAHGMSERTLRYAAARQREFGDIDKGYKKRGTRSIWVPYFKDVPELEICGVTARMSSKWFILFLRLYSKNIANSFSIDIISS